jgi:hypothetical protein
MKQRPTASTAISYSSSMPPPPTAASDAVPTPSTNGIATALTSSIDRGLNASPGESFTAGAKKVWRLPNPLGIALAGK